MHVRKILLVDSDSKNIRILQETFAEKQYKVDHASSDLEAYQRVEQQHYDVVLSEIAPPEIDGHRLLEKLQRNPNTVNIPLIFLTKKSDIWNRIRSFRLGARDFIVKPIHVMEIIARVGMVLSRLEKRDEEEALARKKLVGRLEDLSITDLIETFGVERKTGVLTLNNENGLSGQLFFKSGAVINASTNGLQAEEAVYKMMGWDKGRFSMLFKDVKVADEVSISNLGLLIQGIKRMQSRDAILKQLPSIDSVLVTTSNFKQIIGQKKLTPDLDHFLSLFDGERTLARIIDESSYDDITSLERILKLYRLGFLRALREKSRESGITQLPFDEEMEEFPMPQKPEHAVEPTPTESILSEERDVYIPESYEEEELELQIEAELEKSTMPVSIDDTLNEVISEDKEPVELKDDYSDIPQPVISQSDSDLQSSEEQTEEEPEQEVSIPPQGMPLEEMEIPEKPPTEKVVLEPELKDEEFDVEHLPVKEPQLLSEFEGRDFQVADVPELGESEVDIQDVKIPDDEITEKVPVEQEPSLDAEVEEPSELVLDPTETVKPSIVEKTELLESQPEVERRHIELARAHVLIIGPDKLGRKDIVDALVGTECADITSPKENVSDIYYGTVDFKGGHHLNIMGISTDDEFTPLVDYLAPRTIGYILLIDLKEPDNWNYLGYLIHTLDSKLDTPSMLATCINKDEANSLVGNLQTQLSLADSKRLYICDSFDTTASKRMIFTLFGVDNKMADNVHVVQRSREQQYVLME